MISVITPTNMRPKIVTIQSEYLCEKCGVNDGEDDHTCPFSSEVYGCYDTCNCCDECFERCYLDV